MNSFHQYLRFEFLADGDDVFKCSVGLNGSAGLGDDRTFVQVHADKMGGDPDDFHAVFVGLAVGLRARKARQERGMNVDDFIFVTPNEVRRQNFHEPREHNVINFVVSQQSERLLFRRAAIIPWDILERDFEILAHRCEFAAVGNHHCGVCLKLSMLERGHDGLRAMRFARHHHGHALAAIGLGEADIDFHAERLRELLQTLDNRAPAAGAWAPGSLQRHAELATSDLFLERFDVGVLLKKKIGNARDNTRFVATDDGDSGDLFHD